jgi:hypothetical protein
MATGMVPGEKVRPARSVAFLWVLLVSAAFAAAGFVLSADAPARGAVAPSWIIGQNAISLMERAGEPQSTIANTFASQSTFVYGDTALNRSTPSTFGVPTIAFGSYQDIVAAFETGLLPGKFKAVIYDNERWAYTPLDEQQDPAYYEQQTAVLLHAFDLLYIATPAPDLTWAVGRPADPYQAFLAADMAASAARYADIYDIQGQQEENNLPYFTWFVKAAAAQARAANPHIKIFVGIRTNPGTQALLAAYRATAGIADGYWLNVNGIPGPANDLINSISQSSSEPSPGTSLPPASPSPSANPTPALSPSASGGASPASSALAPPDAQASSSYLTSEINVVNVAANRSGSGQASSRAAGQANVMNFSAGVGVALVLPGLAVLYGIHRGIRRLRRR